MMKRISWRGANRTESGTIEEEISEGVYLVRLDSGKYVIVNQSSIQ